MRFTRTELPEVILIEPDVHRDPRGFFLETYHEEKYRAGGISARFVQDNYSRSAGGIVRGLHAQLEPAQGKLVRVVSGEVWDVAVDVRVGSPTFGKWTSATLSGDNFHQLWIPPGYAHGFCVLSERADVEYKCTAPYRPEGEIAVAWDDPDVAIPWPVADPTLSERDRRAPRLSELGKRLPRFSPDSAVR
jgi:dTDP-4-dehydrorhamnose 3,5-epimerase